MKPGVCMKPGNGGADPSCVGGALNGGPNGGIATPGGPMAAISEG